MPCLEHPRVKQAGCSVCLVDIRAALRSGAWVTIKDVCGCVWRRMHDHTTGYLRLCRAHRTGTAASLAIARGAERRAVGAVGAGA